MSERWDVIIVGAGPAGAVAGWFTAKAGLRTLILERERFPRDKVCGDCVNSNANDILREISIYDRLFQTEHVVARHIRICHEERTLLSLGSSDASRELMIRRSLFDDILIRNAVTAGAEFRDFCPVIDLPSSSEVQTRWGMLRCRFLIAADGKNSFISRRTGAIGRTGTTRVALQTYLALPENLKDTIEMHIEDTGYTGIADVGNNAANLCLVSTPAQLSALRKKAEARYHLPPNWVWRSVSPITREPSRFNTPGIIFCGDAARVSEPFMGDGITFALESGKLAAEAAVLTIQENAPVKASLLYQKRLAELYRGRIWGNRIASFCLQHPRTFRLTAPFFMHNRWLLRLLAPTLFRTKENHPRETPLA